MKKNTNFLNFVLVYALSFFFPSLSFSFDADNYTPRSPSPSFTGIYGAGYMWLDRSSIKGNVDFPSKSLSWKKEKNSYSLGAQAGYSFNVSSFILGPEADIAYRKLKKGSACIDSPDLSYCGLSSRWLGSLSGKGGYAVGPLLLYAKGGVAFTSVSDLTTPKTSLSNSSKSKTRSGLLLGLGAQYAIDQKWFGLLEYNRMSFSKKSSPLDDLKTKKTTTLKENVVKLGIGYNFN